MTCSQCSSDKQAQFTAEVNIHTSGLKNIDVPGLLPFPKVLVCLDCGTSLFSTPKTDLLRLAGPPPREASMLERHPNDTVLSRGRFF